MVIYPRKVDVRTTANHLAAKLCVFTKKWILHLKRNTDLFL